MLIFILSILSLNRR